MANGNGQTPLVERDEPPEITPDDLADAQAQVQAVRDLFPYTLQLTTPVQAHGERCATLTLQLPRAGDVIRAGDPFGPRPGTEPVDMRKLSALISRIAAVPESTVAQLALTDLKAIELLLLPLFLPAAATLSAVYSTSRTSSKPSRA